MQSPFKRKIVGANPTGGTISINRILPRPGRPWILNDRRELRQRVRLSRLLVLRPDHAVAPGLPLFMRERAWMIGERHARIVEDLQHSQWYVFYVEAQCFAGYDRGLEAAGGDNFIGHSSSLYLRKRTDFKMPAWCNSSTWSFGLQGTGAIPEQVPFSLPCSTIGSAPDSDSGGSRFDSLRGSQFIQREQNTATPRV
jgi:hypothetical protein